ncbi:HNH endonuclease [Clostridium sp. VAP52]|uniref:HNH endonuclease n=1 Tax=Clostridium sp. VAP52 TaxID=2949977 RepID=UPI00207A3D12|nr:HNH endonuclease [Clostridium sp. VAP52]
MGVLNKTVEIGLYSGNIKYYENLGYKIPRAKNNRGNIVVPNGTKIFIKVEDLQTNSNIEVDVECDCCKKIYKIKYDTYSRQNHNGKIYCNSCSPKIFNSGKNSYLWNATKTQEERENGRKIEGYTEFVKKVLARDNYICQCCNKHYNYLEVHHLDGYDWCKEKRIDETNGITLCETCHGNFHMKYGKGNNTKEQFEEWIGHTIKELEIYNGKLPIARKIINIITKEIYGNINDCMRKLNIKTESLIYSVCNKKLISANGQKLMWLNEYENSTNEEIQMYVDKPIGGKKAKRKIICLTDNIVFNCKKEVEEYYNIKLYSIINNSFRELKVAEKFLNGRKLELMYYDNYIKKD